MSDMCSCNRSRDYDALLERYEQLGKVARQLYEKCWTHIVLNMHGTKFDDKVAVADEMLRSERELLYDLGVSLDD